MLLRITEPPEKEKEDDEDPPSKDLKARLASCDIVLLPQTERERERVFLEWILCLFLCEKRKQEMYYLGCVTLYPKTTFI